MSKTEDEGRLKRARVVALACAAGLCAPVSWFVAVDLVGEPLRGTRLLLLSVALGLALVEGGGDALIRGTGERFARGLAWVTIALLPVSLGAAASLVALGGIGALRGDLLLATCWSLVLAPPLLTIRQGHLHLDEVLAAGPAAAATVTAGIACLVLAAGSPALLLTAPAAVAAASGAPPGDRTARPGSPLGAALAGAIVASWILAVPPLLATYAGAVPQLTAAIAVSLGFGVAVARILAPSPTRLSWFGAAVVSLSCLVALALLGEFPGIAQLSLTAGVGGLAPVLPLAAVALGAAGTFGLGVALLEPATVAGRPGWAAAGMAAGGLAVTLASAGGPVDLPLRVAAGIGLGGAVAGLLAVDSRGRGARFSVAGWMATASLTAGLGLLPPLDLEAAALRTYTRVPARDLYWLIELEEAETIRAGVDRAGPRCVARTSSGTHLYRGWHAYPPGASGMAAETTLALLPLLAVEGPRTAAVIGLGRGGALEPFRAIDVTTLRLLDPSPHAAAQISMLREPLRDLIAHPAVRLERSSARPALPLPRGSQDVIVVDLPRPALPGARAWYGASLPREIRRSLAPGGWASVRVPTRRLDPGDLAATVTAFAAAFDDATVWVDPVGNGDVILLGGRDGGRPDGARMARGLTRRSLRQALSAGDIRGAEDLFVRAFARADAAAFGEHARSSRGLSWRTGMKELTAREGVPLSTMADAAQPLDTLVDLSAMPPAESARLLASLGSSEAFWPIYLEFLDLIARGDDTGAIEWAERVRDSSGDPTRDLQPFVQQTVEAGRVAEARGRPEDAANLYLLAATFAPQDVDANVELGRQAWAEDRLRAAIRHFGRALDREPEHLVALLGAADAHIRLGEDGPALDLLQRAAAAHPDSVDAQYNLGRLYLELGRTGDALDRFRRVLPIAPDNDRIHFGVAEVHFLRAVSARDAGEDPDLALQEARQAVQRALNLDENALNLALYGQIELVARNYDLAEEALKSSVNKDPDSCDSRAALGEVFFAQKRYDAAARQFQEAREICPQDPRIELRIDQLQHLARKVFEEGGGGGGGGG